MSTITGVKVNASSELNANLALSLYDFPWRYWRYFILFFIHFFTFYRQIFPLLQPIKQRKREIDWKNVLVDADGYVHCNLCGIKWSKKDRNSCRHFNKKHLGEPQQLWRNNRISIREDSMLLVSAEDVNSEDSLALNSRLTEIDLNYYLNQR